MTLLRLGTRGSQLALAQARLVADRLEAAAPGLAVELVTIATAGDRDQATPLAAGERPGWFTTAIQEALQRGEVDIAVHSLKDLPTRRPQGLVIAAVPLREDPRDALVSRTGAPLRSLPPGAVVGTGSPRREAQLRELRPDLDIRPIRGNVETRIRKVREGEYDAAVVALAGLRRLGLEAEAAEIFGFEELLPAPGQGALAVECRADDARARGLLARIDDPAVRLAVTAERSFLAAIEGGCSFPAAAYAEHFGTTLKLHALVASGGRIVRSKMGGPAETAAGLGRQLAEELLQRAGLR
ncbi:MAG: porphobilinogen deaminase [Tepidiforma sp.]|jgi:hydroxymethylbilane synthase|uniref:Porphobilinogen deaminase n=1 Tax=Tepidiforma bonchosmolovskayae TaxID=2601677 RepID=A0ABX6C293_9CHLR|nr:MULTISPECIES: hydroxymethylbilane synthase [Tepidiforma]QFG03373.1 hydroxymethylbilane synthase [Tepidiforma bonchosmolovskayae]GIW16740.1 MAG: porphobilinogen deaminase [Tepidiforma sp.]